MEVINIIKEYLVNIGLDVVKDKISNKISEHQVKTRLEDFIEHQCHDNFNCTFDEEIDFGAIADYLCSQFIEDMRARLFGTKRERQAAHNVIIAKTREYAKANTSCGEKRAIAMVTKAIEILRIYYRSKVNAELLFVTAEITDTIVDETSKQHTEQTKAIREDLEKISQKVSELNSPPIERLIAESRTLIREGQYSTIEDNLSMFLNGIWNPNVLPPNYGYTLTHVDGKMRLKSQPLSEEARKLYPPKIQMLGTAKMDGKYLKQITPEIVDYAYRHQLPIILNIKEAKKLLGDRLDPIQHEAEALVGKDISLPPKPFPDAFPCSISFNDVVEFDYVLFRTQEILDDGTIIVNNREQRNFSFYIEMRANLEKKSIEFNMQISRPSNSDTLKYARVMKKADDGEEISIKVLSLEKELARGNLNFVHYKSSFDSIDEEIGFFEMIVTIEQYFGKQINLPDEIWENEYNKACYLYELIKGDTNKVYWDKLEFPLELTASLREDILSWNDEPHSLSYVGTVDIPLWGEHYEVPIVRTYLSVRAENLEKLKQKATILDIGDQIKLTYLPGEGEEGVWEDSLNKECSQT